MRVSLFLLTLFGALLAAAGALLVTSTAGASPPDALQGAKAASARFHSIEQAEAAGYVQASPCEELPGAGGMGQHWVNFSLMGDPAIDPTQPEILLYAPKENGKLELVGVEYWVAAAAVSMHPTVFGIPLDGPMPGHGPPGAMPVHYDLHVWFWQDNAAGMFAAWNPAVDCP